MNLVPDITNDLEQIPMGKFQNLVERRPTRVGVLCITAKVELNLEWDVQAA